MSDLTGLLLMLCSCVVVLPAAFVVGRGRGYREGTAVYKPALDAQDELIAGLQSQVVALERIEIALREQVRLLTAAKAAMESTIGTQRTHIELLESLCPTITES